MVQHQHSREGTAHELVPYLIQHPHQRFRLIELSSEEAKVPKAERRLEEKQNLATVFAELTEAANHVERETPVPPENPRDVAFQNALQKKYHEI